MTLLPFSITTTVAEVSDDLGFTLGLSPNRAIASLTAAGLLPRVMPSVPIDCQALAPASGRNTQLNIQASLGGGMATQQSDIC